MNAFLEYIVANYTWFLFGTIIILLAIIGSYADKTNFGQGKRKEEKNKAEEKNISVEEILEKEGKSKNIRLQEVLGENKNVKQQETLEKVDKNKKSKTIKQTNSADLQKKQSNRILKKKAESISFEQFDNLFDEVLPKKGPVTGDLLDEVNNLDIDHKSSGISFDDIPSLDNFDLPKIKDLKSSDDDIWKS